MTDRTQPEALRNGISEPSGFHPIETAPRDGTRILLHPAVEVHDAWSKGHWSDQQECWLVGGSASGVTHTYWLPLPPSPSSAAEGGGQSHPDSGQTTGGIVEMLQDRVAELEQEVAHTDSLLGKANALARIRAHCIAELEAQLEAVGAGGVSGPLMGKPQEMPNLSALTERGAKAWAGVDAQGLREGRWYMVTHDGVATLCEDRRDAEEEAKDADMAWPHSGPHRAVQLVEASMAGFTSADMATASAQGFRDGVASVAASVPAPSWHIKEPYTLAEIKAKIASNDYSAEMLLQHAMLLLDSASLAASAGSEPVDFELPPTPFNSFAPGVEIGYDLFGGADIRLGGEFVYVHINYDWKYTHNAACMVLAEQIAGILSGSLVTHPSTPEGTVGVWQDIATAPKDGTRILLHPAIEVADAWSKGHWNDENKCWIVGGSPSGIAHTSWAPLPPAPPTTSAGSKGD